MADRRGNDETNLRATNSSNGKVYPAHAALRISLKTWLHGSPGLGSRSNSVSASSSACRSAGVGEPPSSKVGLVKFGEAGEEPGTVADGQLGQFLKDLSFAHGVNLAQ